MDESDTLTNCESAQEKCELANLEVADADATTDQTIKNFENSVPRELSFDEKFEQLKRVVCKQPSHREIYYKILDSCQQRQILSDLENEIADYPEFKLATFDQYLLITILEKNFGLSRIELDEDMQVVLSDQKEGLDEDEIDDLVAYYAFETTEVGRAFVKDYDPKGRLAQLFDLVPGRKQTYLDVMEFCQEQKRTYKDIEQLLQGKDVLWLGREGAQQALQPSVFVDKLERAGGIVWSDGWQITNRGRELLEEISAMQ